MSGNKSRGFALFLMVNVLVVSAQAFPFRSQEEHRVAERAAREHLEAGRLDAAARHLATALEAAPEASDQEAIRDRLSGVCVREAWSALESGQLEAAYQLLEWAEQWLGDTDLSRRQERRVVEIHERYARTMMAAGRRYEAQPDLQRAIDAYARAATTQSAVGIQAANQKQEVLAKRADLQRLLTQAGAEIEAERWSRAESMIDTVLAQDQSLGHEANALRSQWVQARYQAALRDGRKAQAETAFVDAYQAYQRAATILPSDPAHRQHIDQLQQAYRAHVRNRVDAAIRNDDRRQLRDLVREHRQVGLDLVARQLEHRIETRDQSDTAVRIAYEYAAAREYARAAEAFERAARAWPDRTDLRQKSLNMAQAASLLQKEQDRQHSRALNEDDAYAYWTQKRQAYRGKAWAQAEWARSRDRLGEQTVASASAMGREGNFLVVALYALKALNIAPAESPLHARAKRLLTASLERARVADLPLQLAVVVDERRVRGAPIQADRLRTAAARHIPRNTAFVRVTAGATGSKRLRPSDLRLVLEYQDYDVRTERFTQIRSVQYVAETVQEPNPEYARIESLLQLARQNARNAQAQASAARQQANARAVGAIAQVAAARQTGRPTTFGDVQTQLDGLAAQTSATAIQRAANDAQAEVRRLEQLLRQTPRYTQRQQHATHQYPVEEVTRRGSLRLQVSLRGHDNHVRAAEDIVLTFERSDHAHEGFHPAGISRKTLNIPSEAQVQRMLADQLLTQISAVGAKLYNDHRNQEWRRISAERDPWKRLDQRLHLALVHDARRTEVVSEARQRIPNLPPDIFDQLIAAIQAQDN